MKKEVLLCKSTLGNGSLRTWRFKLNSCNATPLAEYFPNCFNTCILVFLGPVNTIRSGLVLWWEQFKNFKNSSLVRPLTSSWNGYILISYYCSGGCCTHHSNYLSIAKWHWKNFSKETNPWLYIDEIKTWIKRVKPIHKLPFPSNRKSKGASVLFMCI